MSRNPVTRRLSCTILHCDHHRTVDVSYKYDSGGDYHYANQSIEGNDVIKVVFKSNKSLSANVTEGRSLVICALANVLFIKCPFPICLLLFDNYFIEFDQC